jgi:hypothetical protein
MLGLASTGFKKILVGGGLVGGLYSIHSKTTKTALNPGRGTGDIVGKEKVRIFLREKNISRGKSFLTFTFSPNAGTGTGVLNTVK